MKNDPENLALNRIPFGSVVPSSPVEHTRPVRVTVGICTLALGVRLAWETSDDGVAWAFTGGTLDACPLGTGSLVHTHMRIAQPVTSARFRRLVAIPYGQHASPYADKPASWWGRGNAGDNVTVSFDAEPSAAERELARVREAVAS